MHRRYFHPKLRSAKSLAHITEVFLKTITASLPQFLFWKDVHSVYLGCNQNYAHLVGLHSPEEIIGKTDEDLRWQPTGHTADIFVHGDQDTLSGHPITNQQEILVLPNGQKLVALVSKLPIVDEDRHMLGIVGYFSDITELKEKEQALQQAKQQADAANHVKSQFIANMSHDIRTPLTGLLGMAEILADRLKADEDQTAIQDILNSGRLLLNLLNQIIEFSKLENNALPVYELRFNLSELIETTLTLIKPSAKNKQLPIQLEFDEQIPSELIGDAKRLQRILLNLLDNAVRFTQQGSVKLTVKLAKQEHQQVILQFTVRDTGIGIPLDKQELIFTRFSRLHPSYQGIYPGSGLGLALVKRFIQDLEGEVELASQENKGSTFICTIPFKAALLSRKKAESGLQLISPVAETDRAQTILIVEDNFLIQRVLQHQFEELKCVVSIANNAEQAFQKVKAQHYQLIILDLGLPDKNGCELAVDIRQWQEQHRQYTPLVALSAHINPEWEQRCYQAGMVRVFTKPLTQSQAQELLNLSATALTDSHDQPKFHSIHHSRRNRHEK